MWQDSLRQGTYRGVPFWIESSETSIGRRTVVHEYPLRDIPYAEDMGRRARRYQLELFVVGAGYMVGRDQLQAALEKPGAGELVHPFLGRLTVILGGPVKIRESTKEGGLARFSVEFAEAGKATYLTATTDTETEATQAADALEVLALEEYESQYAATMLEMETQGWLASYCARMGAQLPIQAGMLSAVSMEDLSGFVAGDPPPAPSGPNTPQRLRQRQNLLIGVRALKAMALAAWCRNVPTGLASSADVQAAELKLFDLVERICDVLTDSGMSAVLTLQGAVLKDLRSRMQVLPRIKSLLLNTPTPSLVLVWEQYHALSRESEVLIRNGVFRPAYMHGKVEIYV